MKPDPAVKAAAEAALEIGRRRAKQLDRIRRDLLEGREVEALRIMRQLVGITEAQEEERPQ